MTLTSLGTRTMLRKMTSILLLAVALCATAYAQRLPNYYPDSFQRVGTVDDLRDGAIVINDMLFGVSDSVVVHSMSSYRDSLSKIRRGTRIAYRLGGEREVVEIWLLPDDYEGGRDHRGGRR